jgi:hypothetical protein
MPGSMRRFLLAALALVVFVAITLGVARQLGASSAERNAAVAVVKDQAHGDAAAVVRRIRGCRDQPACRARVGGQVHRLRTAGTVRIVRYDGLAGVSLGGRSGVARIVWKAGARLPTVQCVRLRRAGDLIGGYRVQVLALSDPIPREDPCPKG